MKLIRFGEKGDEKPGILVGNKRLDCSTFYYDWDASFFINDGLKDLADLVSSSSDQLLPVDPEERWGSPIPRPGMIMCIGLNYEDHARESGLDIPDQPVLFMKATNTISGPFDDVPIPRNSHKTDWEVELGIVLSKNASYLESIEEAQNHIAGYCIVHDISERAFQLESGGQWVKGKSCPGFSPVGPYLMTADELADPSNLRMTLKVNGKVRQNGNTKTMIFKPGFIVWYLSQYMLVEAGDLISTGTPPGVGLGMNPPTYLKSGDQVELSIEHLGSQVQRFC